MDNSNMSTASAVDRNQAAERRAGRDDDDSGNEDFGYDGDDNDGGMDVDEPEQDPILEDPERQSPSEPCRNPRQTRRWRNPGSEGTTMICLLSDYDGQDGGYNDEPQQEEDHEEREPSESWRSKWARQAKEKKEKDQQKREPLSLTLSRRRRNGTFEITILTTILGFAEGNDSDTHPIQSWRGEHAVARHPRAGEAPVPIMSEVVRIQEENPRASKHRRRGTTEPPSSRNNSNQAEVWVENPDEGWDAETEQNAMVIDYYTKQEMEKVIAQTAAMLHHK